MKHLKTGLIVASAFALGMTVNNFAMSNIPANYNVAVVHVASVVDSSAQVKALKNEQQKKLQELQKWIDVARQDIEKQQTQEGKEKLAKKYEADFAKRQEAVKKEYASKLEAIDKNISGVIAQEAKTQGYDLVLAKGVVLYGGTDITKAIAKKVK